MSTPGDGTDGRSGWCGRGAHHRCIGAYDVVCGCTCHESEQAELSDPAATPTAPTTKETTTTMSVDSPQTPGTHSKSNQVFSVQRPAWACTTQLDPDAVVHEWSAEQAAELWIAGYDTPSLSRVQVGRTDLINLTDSEVQFEVGEDYIFLPDCDVKFFSTAEARKYAAAILACCDHMDGAR